MFGMDSIMLHGLEQMVLSLQISACMGGNLLIIERARRYIDSFVCIVLGFWVLSHGHMPAQTDLCLTKLFHLVS